MNRAAVLLRRACGRSQPTRLANPQRPSSHLIHFLSRLDAPLAPAVTSSRGGDAFAAHRCAGSREPCAASHPIAAILGENARASIRAENLEPVPPVDVTRTPAVASAGNGAATSGPIPSVAPPIDLSFSPLARTPHAASRIASRRICGISESTLLTAHSAALLSPPHTPPIAAQGQGAQLTARRYGAQAAAAAAAEASPGGEASAGEGFARTFLGAWRRENAGEIGYRVVGRWAGDGEATIAEQNAFAVVQVGSHQFKVTAGDAIHVEKLNFAHVNDVVHLEKVLLIGSPSVSLIGRPTLPNAHVTAVVEEHALDAKVIVFKKKRRKNYRRTKGHRQELTRLRIMEVVGVDSVQEQQHE